MLFSNYIFIEKLFYIISKLNNAQKLKENDYLIIVGNSLQSIGTFLGVEAALIEMKAIQRIIITR